MTSKRVRRIGCWLAMVAAGCGSGSVAVTRFNSLSLGTPASDVADRLGGDGEVLFRDDRLTPPVEGHVYRVGSLNQPYVVLYRGRRFWKVCRGADGLFARAAALVSAPAEWPPPDPPPASPSPPRGVPNEGEGMVLALLPIWVMGLPVVIPVAVARQLAARSAADVPLGRTAADVDAVLGPPDRTWPADEHGLSWRRYQPPSSEAAYAAPMPIHVLFQDGRAAAAFGQAMVYGPRY